MSESKTGLDLTFSLDGKTALITGGGSGIGAAIGEMYAAKGARVALADINLEKAAEVAGAIGKNALAFSCDVSDPASVASLSEEVLAELTRVDILVNSAGVVRLDPAEQLSVRDWDATLDINLKGTFLMCQSVGRHMLAVGRGKIINLASQAGSVALDGHLAYCASKFGVIGLSKVLASEWGGRGVTVNTLSPTVVLTALGLEAWAGEKGEAMKKLIPTGRFAYPEEIAAAAVFLGSGASDMINGADLVIDGGYTIR